MHSLPAVIPPVYATTGGMLYHFLPGSTIKFYISPTFPPSEQADIKTAATDWKTAGALAQVIFTTVDPGAQAGNNNVRITEGPSRNYLAYTTPLLNLTTGVLVGADVTFDRKKANPDGSISYSPGIINGGDAFLTTVFDHEFGHVLGADDFRDANGNVIDAPLSSALGIYRGTNNKGFPLSNTLPGNLSRVTPCDASIIINAQNSPSPTVVPGDGGGGPKPPDEDLPTDYSGGGIGFYEYTFVVTSRIIY